MVQSLYDVILGDDDEHFAVLLLLFAYGVIGGSRRQVSQLAARLGLPQSLQFSVMSGWAGGYVMCELSLFIAIAQPPCIRMPYVKCDYQTRARHRPAVSPCWPGSPSRASSP